MKKIFEQYAAYNLLANQRLTEVINNLPDDKINCRIVSSFNSVYDTLVHLWDVEAVWWQRMRLDEQQVWPGKTFTGSVIELSNNLVAQSKQWKEWVDLATEAALQHEFIYKNSRKDQFKQPVYEMLMHLFNHQTYHRGQLITMLRQCGETNIPNTDLIAFLRKK